MDATDTMAKIRRLCAAMGLGCEVVTVRGWSRLFVRATGDEGRQVGRAWQRESAGWTLGLIYRDLRRDAEGAVRAMVNAADSVTRANANAVSAQAEVSALEARLETARGKLADADADRARARVALDAVEAALTDRQRAIIAALEAK